MKKLAILLLLSMCVLSIHGEAREIETLWQIGYHKVESERPNKWMPAIIPGAVQLDVMHAENYKQPYWFGDNYLQFNWMEEYYFTYKTEFKRPTLESNERLYFCSKGIDYHFKILLNDELLFEQEGMFTYVNVDLTSKLKNENTLKIIILPIPTLGIPYDKEDLNAFRKNVRESVKPAVCYGWDWHPRLVTRGIWDETALLIKSERCIEDVDIGYQLNDELTNVVIKMDIIGKELSGNRFRWLLRDPNGEIVIEKKGVILSEKTTIVDSLSYPELWWPNEYGAPNLYINELQMIDPNNNIIEQKTEKIGFRKIKLIMNEGGWKEGAFPLTRAVGPATLEINNRRIFTKGSNWVHPEIFIGVITPEIYERQILLAKKAHFNLLRIWGGGIVNKTSFFEFCDENGMLVWQEFPLACNNYTDKKKYLEILEQEARSIVKRVRKHACLAIWSGGNELFNSWSGMTDQSLALRLLNSICYELDPTTPFIYTSPFYGVGHGHYLFYDKRNNSEVFQWMANANNTAYTEFGVPGVSSIDVLKSFIPDDELYPPKKNTAWESHHGFSAWHEDCWLELPTLEKYFGKDLDLEEIISYSQLLQCEGLKFIYEESRRQKPYCSMALNWCYQEPWPTAANNSLISWPNEIKPAYYHVKNACKPVLASLRIPQFEWHEGDHLTGDLFLLNDTYQSLESRTVTVKLIYNDGEEKIVTTWNSPEGLPFKNIQGPTISTTIPKMKTSLFSIQIEMDGKLDSSYILLYSGEDVEKKRAPKTYFDGSIFSDL